MPPRVRGVAPPALAALRRYPWPGNIRELRNVIYQALVYKRAGDELLLSDMPALCAPPSARGARAAATPAAASIDAAAIEARDGEPARSTCAPSSTRSSGPRCGSRSRAPAATPRGRRGSSARSAAASSADPGGTVRAMMRRLGVAPKS